MKPAPPVTNPYRALARERKAEAIADVMLKLFTADQIERAATEDTWRLAAMAAGVLPAGPETRQMVIAIMRRRAK